MKSRVTSPQQIRRYCVIAVARPDDLPDYERPPIDEVAIGLQFDRIEGFSNVQHIGLLWQRLRGSYPRTMSRPRMETPIEDFRSPREPQLPKVLFMTPDDAANGRTWLVDETDSLLFQVQDTQFVHNWRRRDDEYSHLDGHVDRFWSGYDEFTSMLVEEGLGELTLRQVELTYVNWIESTDPALYFRPADQSRLTLNGLHEGPADFAFNASFIDSADDEPVARLRVEFNPAFRSVNDIGRHGLQMVLNYRTPVSNPTKDVVTEILKRGREVIDNTFTELTTSAAHEIWGRIR